MRLGDLDALKKEFIKEFYMALGQGEDSFDVIGTMAKVIDNAPTVETSKIEHKAYNDGFKDGVEQGIKLSQTSGEWEEDSGNIACSHCHTIWLYRRTDFCPNCGADMRGGKE